MYFILAYSEGREDGIRWECIRPQYEGWWASARLATTLPWNSNIEPSVRANRSNSGPLFITPTSLRIHSYD